MQLARHERHKSLVQHCLECRAGFWHSPADTSLKSYILVDLFPATIFCLASYGAPLPCAPSLCAPSLCAPSHFLRRFAARFDPSSSPPLLPSSSSQSSKLNPFSTALKTSRAPFRPTPCNHKTTGNRTISEIQNLPRIKPGQNSQSPVTRLLSKHVSMLLLSSQPVAKKVDRQSHHSDSVPLPRMIGQPYLGGSAPIANCCCGGCSERFESDHRGKRKPTDRFDFIGFSALLRLDRGGGVGR